MKIRNSGSGVFTTDFWLTLRPGDLMVHRKTPPDSAGVGLEYIVYKKEGIRHPLGSLFGVHVGCDATGVYLVTHADI